MAARRVPVLLITGPVGVGKTTVARACVPILEEHGLSGAYIDLATIGHGWPKPADDPWNEATMHRNLACMWLNFQAAGAARLIVTRVMEHRLLLDPIGKAVPGADVVVVRLRAPLAEVEQRIRSRELADNETWFLGAARYLVDQQEQAGVEDHVVECDARPIGHIASEVLSRIGWISGMAAT